MKLLKIIVFSIAFTAISANAALPPWSNTNAEYSEMILATQSRNSASDIVIIKVLDMAKISSVSQCPHIDEHTVKAKVIDVLSGHFQIGNEIEINYQSKYYNCPGPQTRNLRILKKNKVYDAYLKCKKNRCALAGDAWSFHSKQEFSEALNQIKFKIEYWNKALTK